MFRNWGFLLGEIWVLIALAALIGLIAGWLIWGRRAEAPARLDSGEADRLRRKLAECEAKGRDQAARIATLERDAAAPVVKAMPVPQPAMVTPLMAAEAPLAEALIAARPARLEAARDGQPDDLKLIKGVGPKLEALLHSLGFYHFDQIAGWTAAEIAWVDENLEGFKGRVTRDEWVAQARDLARGLPPRPGGEG